jgi:type VI secretion system secreted protein VgrG
MSTAPSLLSNTSNHLSLTVASGDALDVREFDIDQKMNALFSVVLTVVSDNPSIDFDAILGKDASFSLRTGLRAEAPTRAWAGVVSDMVQIRVEERGLATYKLTIVPELWFLSQRRNYRIFQQISEPDIVLSLLSEWGIEPRVRLTGQYKQRKYRVQYAESDFAFLCRMLEDAGISFYFEQEGEATALVLSDAPQANAARAPIAFKDEPDHGHNEHVTKVAIGKKVRPGRYTLREHDYRRPATLPIIASADAKNGGIEEKLERYHYTPGAFLFSSSWGEETPYADDKGRARVDEAEGAALAQKRLEAKRSSAKSAFFETNCYDLAPGVVTSFLDHPHGELGTDKKLLVVAAKLRGTSNGAWVSKCEVRSADVQFRPPLATKKPKISGVESAVVVGPGGEEIHTDEFGRVRVQFHWDRYGQRNDDSSCWIHVSQPWGGAGFGGVNLPRIGQEVIVDFLGGDPDRPIITGRVYTNLQKVPYGLPGNKTQSGWKSNTSPANGGYNELMFEDKQGEELLRMQAEKDLNKLVKNDEQVKIGNDRTKQVGRDDAHTVGRNRTKHIGNDEREVIGNNRSVVIGSNRATQVGSIDSTIVGAIHSIMISPPGEQAAADATSTVHKPDWIQSSTGDKASITIDGAKIIIKAEEIEITSTKDCKITGNKIKMNP